MRHAYAFGLRVELGLSMTRERAEAVVGDLREAELGSFWFWGSVFMTMIANGRCLYRSNSFH